MPPFLFRSLACILVCFCCLHPLACQAPARKNIDFSKRKAALERAQTREAYEALHGLLTTHYTDLSPSQRTALRQALEKHAKWAFETLCSDAEPGTRLTLKGLVTDAEGKPLPGTKLHIFHTDHRGYYSPLDSITGRMGEGDPRLEGYLTADASGAFEIRTVRPGSYPKPYQGRLIPQHVHVVAMAEGGLSGAFQVVFEDDPAMTPYWVDWANKLRYPIVKLTYNQGRAQGELNLRLERE